LTFPINKVLLSGGLVVNDDQVRAAMRFAFQSMKLVVEPGGAAALAAALAGLAPRGDGATVVVVSGANVDPDLYASVLAS
jgi:threonine dehydratase